MRIILLIIILSYFSPVFAEDFQSDPYYFLFQSAKDDFKKKCHSDSTLIALQSNVFEDISFFEENQLWEAAYHYLSSFNDPPNTLDSQNSKNTQPENQHINPYEENRGFSTNIFIESGIDYSSQNFEILGFEGDSLITEKLTTPNAGLRWNNKFKQKTYQISNSTFLKNEISSKTFDCRAINVESL